MSFILQHYLGSEESWRRKNKVVAIVIALLYLDGVANADVFNLGLNNLGLT